jgi:phage repressor protein C with HTH and peptisase S24 domain
MAAEQARLFLDQTISEQGLTYSDISRLIGKNPAYIQQFIKRGTPRRLNEQDRRTIARHLGVQEHQLSGFALANATPLSFRRSQRSVCVPRISLAASAGHGTLDAEEPTSDVLAFDARWLREIGLEPPYASIIRVDGESMAPTLKHGDEIMIDHRDNLAKLRDGIYVLRLDDVLLVKRIALGPRKGSFSILSDNSYYPSWTDVDPALVTVVGKVVWVGRSLR